MNNHSIAVIDSGVGGLSVWKEIITLLPQESILYLADSAQVPYGTKSADTIKELSSRLVHFLIKKEVKLIVIACNTMTVNALGSLRKEFPTIPIIGTVPVVKAAAEISQAHRIGILSTLATADSDYQKELINSYATNCFVLNKGTDELVPLVEAGETQGEKVHAILQNVLEPFINEHVDTLALGCTHYPFLREEIQKVLGNGVQILDSGAAVARQTERILQNNSILSESKEPEYLFYTTGNVDTFLPNVKKLVGLPFRSIIQKAEHITL